MFCCLTEDRILKPLRAAGRQRAHRCGQVISDDISRVGEEYRKNPSFSLPGKGVKDEVVFLLHKSIQSACAIDMHREIAVEQDAINNRGKAKRALRNEAIGMLDEHKAE